MLSEPATLDASGSLVFEIALVEGGDDSSVVRTGVRVTGALPASVVALGRPFDSGAEPVALVATGAVVVHEASTTASPTVAAIHR